MFGSIQAIRRERGLGMAIGGNRFVQPVAGFPSFDLRNVLADQVAFDAVASDEGQTFLEDLQFSQGPEIRQSSPGSGVCRKVSDAHSRIEFIGPGAGRSC
jgi:hypothetical protein